MLRRDSHTDQASQTVTTGSSGTSVPLGGQGHQEDDERRAWRVDRATQALRQARGILHQRIIGEEAVVERALEALWSRQHLLLLGSPGVAKTTLLETLAGLFAAPSVALMGTADALPSDITGAEIPLTSSDVRALPATDRSLHFPGPLEDVHFVLADEFNRYAPSTQVAFLRAMQQGRVVTAAGRQIALLQPFQVLAAINPQDRATQPLNKANADRFGASVRMGPRVRPKGREYLSTEEPSVWLDNELSSNQLADLIDPATEERQAHPLQSLGAMTDLRQFQTTTLRDVDIPQDLREYIARLHLAIQGWAGRVYSRRAALATRAFAQARALYEGRDFVTDDDVRQVVADVYRGRMDDPTYEAIAGPLKHALDRTVVARSAVASVPHQRQQPLVRLSGNQHGSSGASGPSGGR